jgi:hypothetical protein
MDAKELLNFPAQDQNEQTPEPKKQSNRPKKYKTKKKVAMKLHHNHGKHPKVIGLVKHNEAIEALHSEKNILEKANAELIAQVQRLVSNRNSAPVGVEPSKRDKISDTAISYLFGGLIGGIGIHFVVNVLNHSNLRSVYAIIITIIAVIGCIKIGALVGKSMTDK